MRKFSQKPGFLDGWALRSTTNIGQELSPTASKIFGSYRFADHAQKRLTSMKAKEFDSTHKRISIDLPVWMIELIDREASRLGVTPQTIIQTSLTEHLAANNPS